MVALRGITVSVGYSKELAITLPRNMRHLAECLVVTSHEDEQTQAIVNATPGAKLFITDAFTRHGARFNKGLSLELGFDELGRHGHILILDADILLPDTIPYEHIRPGCLNGCRRRMLEDINKWRPDLDWNRVPPAKENGPIGYFQLFAAEDPAIRDKRPWYDVSFSHAGGGDARFIEHWPRNRIHMLPMYVLHLGPNDTHWFGRDPESIDLMAKFVHRNGWRRAMEKHSRASVERAGELVERVEVPGYEKSTYELPFVRRAQAQRPKGG